MNPTNKKRIDTFGLSVLLEPQLRKFCEKWNLGELGEDQIALWVTINSVVLWMAIDPDCATPKNAAAWLRLYRDHPDFALAVTKFIRDELKKMRTDEAAYTRFKVAFLLDPALQELSDEEIATEIDGGYRQAVPLDGGKVRSYRRQLRNDIKKMRDRSA